MNTDAPAFARTYSDAERRDRASRDEGYDFGHAGMSLRAYFAAHAPATVPDWFKPAGLPPLPKKPEEPGPARLKALTEDQRKNVLDRHAFELAAWTEVSDARECQRAAQWPWAWADLALGAQ